MGTFRFIGTALAVSVTVFLGARWLLVPPAQKQIPQLPSFHKVDVKDPRFQLEQTSFASDNDAVRDALRQAVLDAAVALKNAPCDKAAKDRYIEAAAKYVRAWTSMVPCVATTTCSQSDSARIEAAQKAFGSPLDHRVREAMRRAHATGAIARGDFPDDAARMVASLADDGNMIADASPAFKEAAEALGNGPPVCPHTAAR